MKRKKPLYFILLFAFLAIAIIPYAFFVAIEESAIGNSIINISKNNLAGLSSTTSVSINGIINNYIEKSRVISNNITGYSFNKGEIGTNIYNLYTLIHADKNILGFAKISEDGDILESSSNNHKIFGELNIKKRLEKYSHQLTMQQTQHGLCLPIVTYCIPAKCYLLTILSTDILSQYLQDIPEDIDTEIQILTHNGFIVSSRNAAQLETVISNPEIVNMVYSGASGFLEFEDPRNPSTLISYISPLKLSNISTNFMINAIQEKPNAYQLMYDNKIYTIIPLILVLLIAVATCEFLYRYINNPITELVKIIGFINSGVFEHNITLTRSGELGTLLKSFEQMVKNLEKRFQYQKRMRQEILLRNRYEEKLKSSRAEAVSLSKAKDEFLANISHEIRTPLNAIIGFSEKLLMENPNEPFTNNMRTILRESDHLLLLLNDLLDNAKIEADKLDLEYIPFDLHKCLQTTIDTFTETARSKNLVLSLEISEDTPRHVIFDPLRFKQVLVNLISNALKFTETGSVTIKTAVSDITHDHTDVYFSIIDTGIGISKEKQESIFDEFSQADGSTTRKFGGTGLGTTISKKLVTLMGGEMCLKSELGKGSTFWFTLSLNTNISEKDLIDISREANSLPTDNANSFNGTILVAEDYEVNQELIKSQLEYLGLNVLIAQNGRVALEDCKRVFFDLILMDLQMPEMGGIEAARRIRIDYPHYEKVPIIALTANADKDVRNVCKAVGMNGILNKPTHIDELAASLLKWLPKSCKKTATVVLHKDKPKAQSIPLTTLNQNERSPACSLNEELPVYLEEAYALFGNNKMVFNMALNNFLTSVENDILPTLQEALENKDCEILRRTAHKLKGGSASITAKKLSKLAGILEKCSEKNDIAEAPDLICELKTIFTEVKEYVANNT